MTPAIDTLNRRKIDHVVHEYVHDARSASYGEEAAEVLGVPADRVFKTLVADTGDRLVVGVVPVSGSLDLKQLARAAGAKKVKMAAPKDVERSSGYVLGGVSPVGQKRALKTFIDESAVQFPTIFVSAGRRGLEIELAPEDLRIVTDAAFAAIAA